MSQRKQAQEPTESLVHLLAGTDGMVREAARQSLVALEKRAVPSLSSALQHSKVTKVRWEAAKALGAIGDARAIPSLVKALDDRGVDVGGRSVETIQECSVAGTTARTDPARS